jgi:predicted alpha/beta-hydrolase family hydrolase
MWFMGSSNHGKGAPRQEISKWSMVCSTFLRSGWSVVRSALLFKRGTSKKRLSPQLHKVLTWSNKVNPWTLQTALIILQLQMTNEHNTGAK